VAGCADALLERLHDRLARKRTPCEGEIGRCRAVEGAETPDALRAEPLRAPSRPAAEIVELLPGAEPLPDE